MSSLDRRIRLGQAVVELVDLGLQAFDLRGLRVRGFAGVLQLLKPVLELGAQVRVGPVAVEGGAVDAGLGQRGS